MPKTALRRNPTRRDVAQALRCSVKTVIRAENQFPIRTARAGRTIVLDFDDVQRWAGTRGFEVVPEVPRDDVIERVAEVLGLAR
jgi:DNA-binding transcriptional MocR family regulator